MLLSEISKQNITQEYKSTDMKLDAKKKKKAFFSYVVHDGSRASGCDSHTDG